MKSNSLKFAIILCAVFFSARLGVAQTFDSCAILKSWESIKPASQKEAKEQYDTLKLYIEKCAASDGQSFRAFTSIDGAVGIYSPDDPTRFDTYRAWLISVINLNTTEPAYFCAVLGSIAGTYQYGKYSPLGYLAVLDYVRNHHRECWGSENDNEFAADSTYDARHGADPTHLPSLDSMGLGFLLGHSGVSSPTQYIASFTSCPNPFKKEFALQFTLSRMTYTTVSIYDELGRLVWGEPHGVSLEAGIHSIHIDASSFPSGTLYARISTGFGEVKTVKLVHEK